MSGGCTLTPLVSGHSEVAIGTRLARGARVIRGRAGARRRPAWPGQLARFIVVGVASTAAYVVLYLLLRAVMAAQAANALSLLITAIANTAANRRLTFGIRGRGGRDGRSARQASSPVRAAGPETTTI